MILASINCSLTDPIFTNTKIIGKSRHWSLLLYQYTITLYQYTITLWFPCLDGLIQTRGKVARVTKSTRTRAEGE